MQDLIKIERQLTDAIINAAKFHIGGSREISLSVTNLQRGNMFLGKFKGALGGRDPYPESRNHNSQKIEAQADQATDVHEVVFPVQNVEQSDDSSPDVKPAPALNRIGKIKYLRGLIQDRVDGLVLIRKTIQTDDKIVITDESMGWTFLHNSILALIEAGMWLGVELNNIRENDLQYERNLEQYQLALLKSAGEFYEAYGNVTNFKNFQGNPMPKFEELPDQTKEAWKAVVMTAGRIYPPHNRNWEYEMNNTCDGVGVGERRA